MSRTLARVAALYVVLWGVDKLERIAFEAGRQVAEQEAEQLPAPTSVIAAVVLLEQIAEEACQENLPRSEVLSGEPA